MPDDKSYTFNMPGGNTITVRMPKLWNKQPEAKEVREVTDTQPGAVDDNATKRISERNQNMMKNLEEALDTQTDAERRVFPRSYREDED